MTEEEKELLKGESVIRRGAYSIEQTERVKTASLRAMKDSGASPSICHSGLARDLGLTRERRSQELGVRGAFDTQDPNSSERAQRQVASEYVVMVVTVKGYREEYKRQGSENWIPLYEAESAPAGAPVRRVEEHRKFVMHAELSETLTCKLIFGQNVNVDHRIVAFADENRSTFFRGKDMFFVPHDIRIRKGGRIEKPIQVASVQLEDEEVQKFDVENNLQSLAKMDIAMGGASGEESWIEHISTWRRTDHGQLNSLGKPAPLGLPADEVEQSRCLSANFIARLGQLPKSSIPGGSVRTDRIRIILAIVEMDRIFHWLPRRMDKMLQRWRNLAEKGETSEAYECILVLDRWIDEGHEKWAGQYSREGCQGVSSVIMKQWYFWFLMNVCAKTKLGFHAAEELFRSMIHQGLFGPSDHLKKTIESHFLG